jgi:hypothetical protein
MIIAYEKSLNSSINFLLFLKSFVGFKKITMAQQSTRGTSFFVRAAARATAVTALPMTIAGALYHRPQPDLEQEDWGGPMHYSPKPFTEEQRNSARWFSRQADNEQQKESLRLHEKLKHLAKPNSRSHEEGNNLMDRNIMFEEFQERILAQGHRIFQYIILGACNATIWIGMGGMYNSHAVLQDSHYHNFIQLVRRLKEQKIANSVARLGFSTTPCSNEEIDMAKKCTSPVALLTVSNHASTIDDPVLFGLLLPTDIKHDPDYIRWTLCSQEICFKKTALAAIFGAGKIMPIRRGGGIDQPLLLRFAQKIASGDWVHVFPEGKVVQSGQLGENYLGTRSVEDANEIGRLKWGVGKIIAHSPVDVHVIPIHHKGMEVSHIPKISSKGVLRNYFLTVSSFSFIHFVK